MNRGETLYQIVGDSRQTLYQIVGGSRRPHSCCCCSGCADLVTTERCLKTCNMESTTCEECGANGLYLERFAPKVCRECLDYTWGSNGLSCTPCPPLRVSAANHMFCMCGYGTVFKPPEDCVCPAGH